MVAGVISAALAGGYSSGGGGGGGISYVSGSSTTYASRTNTVVTAPTGIANDDVLLAQIFTLSVNANAPDPTPPSGFTQIGTTQSITANYGGPDNFNAEIRHYIKKAASESGDYTFTHSTCSSSATIQVYRGVDGTTAEDATSTSATGNNATRTWTGLTTVTNGAWIVAMGVDYADTANNLTPPSGMTERLDVAITYVADEARATAGATGDRSHTCNNNQAASPWAARLIALRPA